jgi:hypothetical protein
MPNGKGMNLEKLVELYNKERLYGFLMCLKQKENLADCVTGCLNKGQLTSTHDAKFHSHVRRFPSHREAVLEVANKITEEEVLNGEIETFEQLIGRINLLYGYAENSKNHVKFFGPLYIYDTAIRIGYHLSGEKIMPDKYVYVQAGALRGAQNLCKVIPFTIETGKLKKVVTNDLLDVVPELKKLADLSELNRLLKGQKELKELQEWIKGENNPTKALIIEDFFCVFDDYLDGSPTRK